MKVEVFNVGAACRSERAAKVGISIQPNYTLGERIGVFRLSENTIANYLWSLSAAAKLAHRRPHATLYRGLINLLVVS